MSTRTEQFSNVHYLKPSTLTLSDKLDAFLEENSLGAKRPPRSSPSEINFNKIACASCGQKEYLSRQYCSCGHFLAGQLEDEFIIWSLGEDARIKELQDQFCKNASKSRLLLWPSLLFLMAPLLQIILNPTSFGLASFLWFLPALTSLGIVAASEGMAFRRLSNSTCIRTSWDYTSFLVDRARIDLEGFSR